VNPFGQRIPVGAIVSHQVDNAGLIADVVAAARVAAGLVAGGLPRDQAGPLAWAYAKAHTRYLEETDPDMQTPRMPWRFVADGVGDCKSTAIYIAAVCAASGCEVLLRFVTLPGDTLPGHVYAVVDGIPCDPLLELGEECLYIRGLDFRIP